MALDRVMLLTALAIGPTVGAETSTLSSPAIPFPDALEGAGVEIKDINNDTRRNIRSKGLVVGNGEITPLFMLPEKT